MLVSNQKTDTNLYELEIKVDADRFEAAVEQAYRTNGRKMNVPGFRKGKAPRKMIEKLYGEGVFYEDAINALYNDALFEAVDEAGLELVTRPEVEITAVSHADGFTMKAKCTVRPEVTVKKYKGIEATKTVKAVTDEDIENELHRLQERGARTITVEGRAAETGDQAKIDFEGFVDGEAFEGGKGEGFDLTLGSNTFIPGFEDQVVGHSAGETFDVNVTFPEDYHAEELKGKDAVFHVTLHELKARELPELDDEFAKDVSEFDTLEELKADLQKKMAEENEKSAETEVENRLIDVIIENMEAEIPDVMYENRVDEEVRNFDMRLQQQGMSLDLYLQYTGMEMDSFRKQFREPAEKQVKIRLALEEIVKLEKIEVPEEELNAEYAKLAEQYKMDEKQVRSLIPEDSFKMDLAVNKAIDLVKENAKIKNA